MIPTSPTSYSTFLTLFLSFDLQITPARCNLSWQKNPSQQDWKRYGQNGGSGEAWAVTWLCLKLDWVGVPRYCLRQEIPTFQVSKNGSASSSGTVMLTSTFCQFIEPKGKSLV
jgi:hypothetical protein